MPTADGRWRASTSGSPPSSWQRRGTLQRCTSSTTSCRKRLVRHALAAGPYPGYAAQDGTDPGGGPAEERCAGTAYHHASLPCPPNRPRPGLLPGGGRGHGRGLGRVVGVRRRHQGGCTEAGLARGGRCGCKLAPSDPAPSRCLSAPGHIREVPRTGRGDRARTCRGPGVSGHSGPVRCWRRPSCLRVLLHELASNRFLCSFGLQLLV